MANKDVHIQAVHRHKVKYFAVIGQATKD